jgi:hypothetical protein
MDIIFILLQNINILSNEFETGTQGSIDGYIVSLFVGIILSITIILIYIFQKKYFLKRLKSIYVFLLLFSLLLYITNFKFLYYVTIIGYSINDVITDIIKLKIADISNNNVEKIFPIVFYIMITINVVICMKNILKKRNDI